MSVPQPSVTLGIQTVFLTGSGETFNLAKDAIQHEIENYKKKCLVEALFEHAYNVLHPIADRTVCSDCSRREVEREDVHKIAVLMAEAILYRGTEAAIRNILTQTIDVAVEGPKEK